MNKILRYLVLSALLLYLSTAFGQTLNTCAEVIAGEDGTTFRVKGECTKITNSTYGNWLLKDETGEITVYGTLDADGNTKNFSSLNIEVGDIVTVEGPKKTYTNKSGDVTIELVDVKVIAIEKGQSGKTDEINKVTIAEFNAAAESTDVWYQLTGTIKNLKDDDQYGNFDLEDATGSVYVYGLLSEKGGEKKKFQELVAEKGIKNGDKLTLIGNRGSYKDKIEVLNAYFVSVEPGEVAPNDDPEDEDLFGEFKFTSGNFTDTGDQLVFEFEGFLAEEAITGVLKFNFEKDLCISMEESLTFATEEQAQTAYAEAVAEAKEEGYTSVKIDGKTVTVVVEGMTYLSRIVIKALLKMSLDNEDAGDGTQESPMTANLANILAGTLESGAVTEDDCYVKGKIARITYPFDEQHGTATFFISADGKDDFTFQAYSVYYLENKAWQDGDTQIQVGDDVVICGKLTNYKGTTPETASKKAYIYSLNGVISGISTVQSELVVDAPVYNLSGQRVEHPSKGLYIRNGRKYLVK